MRKFFVFQFLCLIMIVGNAFANDMDLHELNGVVKQLLVKVETLEETLESRNAEITKLKNRTKEQVLKVWTKEIAALIKVKGFIWKGDSATYLYDTS